MTIIYEYTHAALCGARTPLLYIILYFMVIVGVVGTFRIFVVPESTILCGPQVSILYTLISSTIEWSIQILEFLET